MSETLLHKDKKVSEALGLWEPKRTLTLEAARRHSARIKRIRQILIGLAVALAVVLMTQFLTQNTAIIVEDDPNESVKMTNPRYSGRTKDGLPFWLTADAAIRTSQNSTEVDLVNPVLNFLRNSGVEKSVITAASGQYDDVTQVLNLVTDVDLKTDDGYHCITTHARIFARDKRIEGDKPIECQGSFGNVNGNQYEILDAYSVFVFKGGMDAFLESDATPPPETAGTDDAQTGTPNSAGGPQ